MITLDTDTQLPRDAARQLVGSHGAPAQPAALDERLQRVREGYGILQPRVAREPARREPVPLRAAVRQRAGNRSVHARRLRCLPGPVRRRLVHRQGIYDVDAFEQALNGRFPENRILSHDLLEGCYARSGLLSDVQLYEEYPSRYAADVSRRHRWIRGDWQIARWLLPRVPARAPAASRNPLSALSRWKIFDNLRRSLVPPALTLLLLLGWTVLTPAWFWTLAVVAIILAPPLIASLLELFQKPERRDAATASRGRLRGGQAHFAQAVFALACLPLRGILQPRCHRAHDCADAGHPPAAAGMESVER